MPREAVTYLFSIVNQTRVWEERIKPVDEMSNKIAKSNFKAQRRVPCSSPMETFFKKKAR
jgi:hypothetical protein